MFGVLNWIELNMSLRLLVLVLEFGNILLNIGIRVECLILLYGVYVFVLKGENYKVILLLVKFKMIFFIL